jgi:hypothetical protein
LQCNTHNSYAPNSWHNAPVITFEKKSKDASLTPVVHRLFGDHAVVDRTQGVQRLAFGPSARHVLIARCTGWVEAVELVDEVLPVSVPVVAGKGAPKEVAEGEADVKLPTSLAPQVQPLSTHFLFGAPITAPQKLPVRIPRDGDTPLVPKAPKPETFITLHYAGGMLITCTNYGTLAYTRLPWLEAEEEPNSIPLPQFQCSLGPEHGAGTGLLGAMTIHPKYPHLFATGGKDMDLHIWDVREVVKQLQLQEPSPAKLQPIWRAKNMKHDALDLKVPVWITAISFITMEQSHASEEVVVAKHKPHPRQSTATTDGQGDASIFPEAMKVVVGTAHHHIKVYDTSRTRRPVLFAKVGEYPVRAMSWIPASPQHPAGEALFSDTTGNLTSVDLVTGDVSGGYRGLAGAATAVAAGTDKPMVVSAGLDRYVRVFEREGKRRCIQKVYIKQRAASVVLDEHYQIPVAGTTAHGSTTRAVKKARMAGKSSADADAAHSEAEGDSDADSVWDELEDTSARL